MSDDGPVDYEDFRTGLSWDQVREELYAEQEEVRATGNYMWVSRGTVLGRMHQHKMSAYADYLRQWEADEGRIDDAFDCAGDECWTMPDDPEDDIW